MNWREACTKMKAERMPAAGPPDMYEERQFLAGAKWAAKYMRDDSCANDYTKWITAKFLEALESETP